MATPSTTVAGLDLDLDTSLATASRGRTAASGRLAFLEVVVTSSGGAVVCIPLLAARAGEPL